MHTHVMNHTCHVIKSRMSCYQVKDVMLSSQGYHVIKSRISCYQVKDGGHFEYSSRVIRISYGTGMH